MNSPEQSCEKPVLAEMLPQAAPMILLSGYETPDADGVVDAYVDVTSASPFFDAAIDGVPACVALEYMAQTMALCVGFHRRRQGLAPQLGFVLGSRRMKLGVGKFAAGRRYRVHSACTFQDEEFGSFDCTIRDEGDAVVASASLTAFQPGDEMLRQ
jgi:predicted hotdog family 3-hydroxylacyl-ACP dehydratase